VEWFAASVLERDLLHEELEGSLGDQIVHPHLVMSDIFKQRLPLSSALCSSMTEEEKRLLTTSLLFPHLPCWRLGFVEWCWLWTIIGDIIIALRSTLLEAGN
jgi:hypothetical protein